MKPHFPQASYHTPPDTPNHWLDKLSLGSGAYLYARFLQIIVHSSRQAVRGEYSRQDFAQSGYDIMRLIETCGGRFHITGFDHLRNTPEPVVFISNHMSALENNVFPGLIAPFKPFTYVVKASLLKYPIFGSLVASQNPIPVERADPRADLKIMLDEGHDRLKNGISVLVFPQGGRTNKIDRASFNKIGVKLAKKAGVAIMPIAVKTNFWQNGRLLRDFGFIDRSQPIHFAFGSPIAVGQNTREAHNEALDFIHAHLTCWHEEANKATS